VANDTIMGFVMRELASFRERAGITRSELARAAGVDRATLARAEAAKPSRKETLFRIGNALNELHYGSRGKGLDLDALINPEPSTDSPIIATEADAAESVELDRAK
jgi:transcriptional regulator with XRE-family HTH domain